MNYEILKSASRMGYFHHEKEQLDALTFSHATNLLDFLTTEFKRHLKREISTHSMVVNDNHTRKSVPALEFLDLADAGFTESLQGSVNYLAQIAQWHVGYGEKATERMQTHFGYCSVIGPEGLVMSSDIQVGMTILGPNTFYPWHRHQAKELYYIASQHSSWGADKGELVERNVGEVVVHDSFQAHAMKTTKQSLLALWLWEDFVNSDLLMES